MPTYSLKENDHFSLFSALEKTVLKYINHLMVNDDIICFPT